MKSNTKNNMINTMNKFYKALLFCAILVFTISLASCEKEQKKYEGDPQLAFSNTTYNATITPQKTSITIPIQLIAKSAVEASGKVNVDPASTCADAVTFNPQFTIDPATFSYNLVISVNYAALKTGKNTLVLDLESSLPVAKYYSTATITLTK